MLVTYYSMLLAWVCNAFFDSFGENNFWSQEQVTGSEAKAYFYDTIIGMSTLGPDLRPTRLVGKNVGYSFLTWTVIYFCVAFGVKTTGRITYFTMGLPGEFGLVCDTLICIVFQYLMHRLHSCTSVHLSW